MTLEEMLALLPDNNTGAIDAADLRTIVTELWDDMVTGFSAAHAEIQAVANNVGSIALTGRWQVIPTAGASPAPQQMSADTEVWADATVLRIARIDQTGLDALTGLMNATVVRGQMLTDATQWARFTVTGTPVDYTTYVEIPVQFEEGAGSISTAGWQTAVLVMTWPVA